jgi:hypothetical protein
LLVGPEDAILKRTQYVPRFRIFHLLLWLYLPDATIDSTGTVLVRSNEQKKNDFEQESAVVQPTGANKQGWLVIL